MLGLDEVFEQVAANNGVTKETVLEEIENAIRETYARAYPNQKELLSLMSHNGGAPSPEEFIRFARELIMLRWQ